MKIITTLVVLCTMASLRGATQDTALNVNLLPNTEYSVDATVSTSALDSLITLLSGGPSPFQIVDNLGNVLAELPVDDLINSLTESNGEPVTIHLKFDTAETVGAATDLVARVLDSPLLQVSNVSAAAQPKNRAPTVSNVTRKKTGKSHNKVMVRGLAKDSDGSVKKVEVIYRNTLKKVNGTTRFRSSFRLQKGSHVLKIRAIDNEGQTSVTKRFQIRSR